MKEEIRMNKTPEIMRDKSAYLDYISNLTAAPFNPDLLLEKRWDEATEELRTFIEPVLVEIHDQRTASASETEMTPLVRKQQQIRQAAERRLATRYPRELAEIVGELES